MTKQHPVHFSDRPYQRSHMKAPRGYGSWAFSFEDMGDDAWFAPSSTLADAKRAARDEARRRAAIYNAPADAVLYVDILP